VNTDLPLTPFDRSRCILLQPISAYVGNYVNLTIRVDQTCTESRRSVTQALIGMDLAERQPSHPVDTVGL